MGSLIAGILGLGAALLLWPGSSVDTVNDTVHASHPAPETSMAVPQGSDESIAPGSERHAGGSAIEHREEKTNPTAEERPRLNAGRSETDDASTPPAPPASADGDGVTSPTAIGIAPALILDSAGLARLGVTRGRDEITFRQVKRTDPATLKPMAESELPVFQYSLLNFGVNGFGSRRGGDVSEDVLAIAPVLVTMQNRVEGRSESAGAFPELRSPFIDSAISRFSLPPREGELEQIPEGVLQRLVPVHVQFAVAPRGATTPHDVASVTLWYAPTDAFLRAIPIPARATIETELQALGQSAKNCSGGRLRDAVLGACLRNSATVRGLSAQSSVENDEAVVSFALSASSRVSIELYDRWGGFVRKLSEETLGSGEHAVLARLDGIRRGEYQIASVTDAGDTAVATFVHQQKRRVDPEEELRRKQAAADRAAAQLGLETAVRTPAKLELTPPELARLGIDYTGDTIRAILFGGIDGSENAAIRQRYREAGYHQLDSATLLRFSVIATAADASSELLPHDRSMRPGVAPIAIRHAWETKGGGMGSHTISPIVPRIAGANMLELVDEMRALFRSSGSDQSEIAQHWSRRLVPVTIHLEDPPTNSRAAKAKVTLVYVATPEFAALLPDRYRNQLLLEIAALRRLEARETTPDEVCRELPGGATFLDLCGMAAGAISAGSVWPNPVLEMANVTFTLASPREVTIALHDLSGRFLKLLHKGALGAGGHTVSLPFNDVESGSYLVSLRTKDREQVVMRVIVK